MPPPLLLVVDDDPSVRGLVVSLLRAENFEVIAAERSQDALAAAASLERPLDLLIADVNLPGVDGRHLAIEISLLHPDAKVLYMSGMPQTALDELGVLGGGDLIEKPFELNEFVRLVRDKLGR
jgi:two-component system, cell cycle sensor histidine kinase and response regulator CckA